VRLSAENNCGGDVQGEKTGMDMKTHYKETSLAGLALNLIEC